MKVFFEGTPETILKEMKAFIPQMEEPVLVSVPKPEPKKEEPAPAQPEKPVEVAKPEPPKETPAPAKKYSKGEILTAVGDLFDRKDEAINQALRDLNSKYGVRALNELPEEYFDHYVQDIKALGAAL